MSSALNSVFGGGGIVGAALNIASVAFPPLGIATSLANLVTQGVGQAVNQAAQTLTQVAGMPKFIAQEVMNVVARAVDNLTQPSDADCDHRCGGDQGVRNWQQDFVQELCKGLVDKVKEEMQCEGKKGGGKKAGSWLEALARALGEVAGEKASKMVELSNKISGLAGDSSPEAAKEMTALNSELSGTSKMFSLLQETLNTTVKSIGDGLTTVARKS